MTWGPRAPLPARTLSLALLGTCIIELAASSLTREFAIANHAARGATYPLGLHR